ncbi:MAG: single-stranded DNA-binding protein [Firmicutes bacterium]|nr:single-stranded DNA-binding protein [Bacillota bacterium]
MNSFHGVGRIATDIELKYTPNGVPVARARLAITRAFKNVQGEYESDFFTLIAWRATAEFLANHFAKGRRIGVSGRLQSRQYTDAQGVRREVVEIVADNLEFVDNKPAEDREPAPVGAPTGSSAGGEVPELPDDLPF